MVKGVSGNSILLVRFIYGCDNYMALNKLTTLTVDRIPMTKEYEFPKFSVIPDNTTDFYNGYFRGIYFLLHTWR